MPGNHWYGCIPGHTLLQRQPLTFSCNHVWHDGMCFEIYLPNNFQ